MSMRRIRAVGVWSIGLALASCSAPTHRSGPLPDVDAMILPLMEAAQVPGLTFAVVEHGELVLSKAYGKASLAPPREVATDTIFEAASVGKVVFALIVLRLADRGVIDLDASIAGEFDYPLLDHDARFARLTPRLILQHASGLPNWGGFALDPNRGPVRFLRDPGEGFGYSGEAYMALQRFVEVRTGRSLEDLFVDLAGEFGMRHSSFLSQGVDSDRYARGIRDDGTERQIFEFSLPGSAYSLTSTAEDLARFTAAFFHDSGLSKAAFDEALRPINPVAPDAWGAHVPEGARLAWSLAWGVQDTDDDRVYFHAGNNGEFRSFCAYSASRDVAAVVMANGANGLSFVNELFEPFVGDVTPAAVWWGYVTTEPAGSRDD